MTTPMNREERELCTLLKMLSKKTRIEDFNSLTHEQIFEDIDNIKMITKEKNEICKLFKIFTITTDVSNILSNEEITEHLFNNKMVMDCGKAQQLLHYSGAKPYLDKYRRGISCVKYVGDIKVRPCFESAQRRLPRLKDYY
jgi:hypothetical protein